MIVLSPGLAEIAGVANTASRVQSATCASRRGVSAGHPFRSFVGDTFMGGYSDHFRSTFILVREKARKEARTAGASPGGRSFVSSAHHLYAAAQQTLCRAQVDVIAVGQAIQCDRLAVARRDAAQHRASGQVGEGVFRARVLGRRPRRARPRSGSGTFTHIAKSAQPPLLMLMSFMSRGSILRSLEG